MLKLFPKQLRMYLRMMLLLILIASSKDAFGQLSGTYSVGGSSPNFPNLDSAFNYMEINGISGNVRLNVRSGTHALKTRINSISGADSSRGIHVGPDPTNNTPVIFKSRNTSSSNNYLVDFRQGYIRFDSCTFILDSTSSFGTIISFTAACTNITFNACRFFGKDTNSISNNFIIVNNTTTYKVEYLKFNLCEFYDGSIAVSNTGASSNLEKGNEVLKSKILVYHYIGLYSNYQTNNLIQENYVKDKKTYPGAYGIYYVNCAIIVSVANKIYLNGQSGYGFHISYSSGTSSKRIKVHNNIIVGYDSTKSGQYTGVLLAFSSYIDFCFNTILSYNKDSSSNLIIYNMNSGNKQIMFKNNILIHYGKGRVVQINNDLASNSSWTHNNIYTNGNNFAFWVGNGGYYKNMNTYKIATTLDSNSISIKLDYKDVFNPRTINIYFNNKGTPILGITTDIDGENRDTTAPDIGADEYTPPITDAGITKIIQFYCIGSQSIKIQIINYGINTINSCKLQWQIAVDGGSFSSPSTQTFSLALSNAKDTILSISNYTFNLRSNYRLKVWLTEINGIKDSLSSNDTFITNNFYIPFKGVYTIGGNLPDFPSIDSAFNDMELHGVCGPVRLLLRSGTYTEQISIDPIRGSSQVNTITLVSDPSNSTIPKIEYASTTFSKNFVFQFNGVSYITIDSLSLQANGSDFGTVLRFQGRNHHIQIQHDSIIGILTNVQTSTNLALLNSKGAKLDYSVFSDCVFLNGSVSLNISSDNNIDVDYEVKVERNKLLNFSSYGIVMVYQARSQVIDNYIYQNFNSTVITTFGIGFTYASGLAVNRNQIFGKGSWTSSGIKLIQCIGSRQYPNVVSNNTVQYENLDFNFPIYGIIKDKGKHCKFYFNTVQIKGGDTSSCAFISVNDNADTTEAFNNYFINLGPGFCTRFVNFNNNGIIRSGNNAYRFKGKYLASYKNNVASLSDLNSQLVDLNSFLIFSDFHMKNSLIHKFYELNNKGIPINLVKDDYFKTNRDSINTDIGVYEFTPYKEDLELSHLDESGIPITCGYYKSFYIAIIKNNGTDTIRKILVKSIISCLNDDTFYTSDSFNVVLLPGKYDTLKLSNFSTIAGGVYKSQVFLSNSNEDYRINDTLVKSSNNLNTSPKKLPSKTETICDNATYNLRAYHDSGSQIRWFSALDSGRILSRNDTLQVRNISKDSIVYVNAVYPSTTYNKYQSFHQGPYWTPGGTMFNVKPKKDLFIDSLSLLFGATGFQKVYVYMRYGGYKGYENNSSAWRLVDSASLNVVYINISYYYKIHLTNTLFLEKDSNFGIYLQFYSATSNGSGLVSTEDLDFEPGVNLSGKFSTVTTKRVFNGTIFYKAVSYCEGEKTAYNLKVNKSPIINIGKDTSYCASDGINYILNAGNGFSAYKWNKGDTTQTLTVNDGGKYQISVTDANGCIGTDELIVKKNLNPDIKLGKDSSYCASAGIDKTLNVNFGYASYLWSNGSKSKSLRVTNPGFYYVNVVDYQGCSTSDSIRFTRITNPIPSIGKDTFYCNKDGLSLLLKTGSTYNRYLWSDFDTTQTKRVTSKGTYILTVEDAFACKGSDTILVSERLSPTIKLPNDTFYCEGNTFIMSLNVGNGYKNYQWSSGQNFQNIFVNTKGNYSVTVTATNDCIGKDTFTLNEISIPVNLGKDTGYCKGNSFNLTLDPGSSFQSYKWSDLSTAQTLNLQTKGFYSIAVVGEKGCKGHDTILISELDPKINLGKDTSYCSNDGILTTLDAGADYLQYEWQGGYSNRTLTIDTAGIYKVTVISAFACKASDSIKVSVLQSPQVNLGNDRVLNPDLILNETIDAGAGFSTYLWSNLDTNRSIQVTQSGTYFVEVSLTNGCKDFDTIIIRQWDKTDLKEILMGSINIYPNPADDIINFTSNTELIRDLNIYDTKGQLLYKSELSSLDLIVDVSSWADGLYFASFTVNGKLYTVKLIVN